MIPHHTMTLEFVIKILAEATADPDYADNHDALRSLGGFGGRLCGHLGMTEDEARPVLEELIRMRHGRE